MSYKRWDTDGKKYDLIFSSGLMPHKVLSFCQDKEDPMCFWYCSDELKVEYDCEFADSIEEAKELFEEMYREHLEDMVSYYEENLKMWDEAPHADATN